MTIETLKNRWDRQTATIVQLQSLDHKTTVKKL